MSHKGVPKTGRKHTLSWYSENYGFPLHCAIHYHRQGWPLDDPAEVLRRILGQRSGKKPPLDRLQRFADAQARGISLEEPEPPPVMNGNGYLSLPDVNVNDGKTSIRRQVEFLEQEVERAKADYLGEIRPVDRYNKSKTLQALIQTLHKLSRDVPIAEIEAGNSLKRSEVDAVWTRLLKELRVQFDALPRRVALHPMFKKIDPVAVEELLCKERDQILKILVNGGGVA